MASRAEKLLEIPAKGLWIGTFHGICVRILRREAGQCGFKRDFTIYDRDDQLSAIKKVMGALGINKNRLNPSHALNIIGRAKNDFVPPDKLDEMISGQDSKLYIDIYRRYGEFLTAAGAFDFDDLLVRTVDIFSTYPDILNRWRRRFSHILVDEYQDTNHTQYLLIKLLCGDSGKVTVVGDDDQSIYGWRGANIQNILGFESEFKGVKTVRLEKNYRSTGNILTAANAVMTNNKKRMTKNLWTDRTNGAPVKIIECMSDLDEAEQVVASIERERRKHGNSLKDSVILYRTNAQSRSFEDVLIRRRTPYVIVGGLRFYERKEIKDILAYLRIIVNPDDTVSFSRAVTTPKRGIGSKTIEAIEKFASQEGITLINAIGRAGEVLSSGKILERLKEFHEMLHTLSEMRGKAGLDEIGDALITMAQYEDLLENEYPDNFEDRINNVNELITAMGEYENITDEDDLSTFLAEISLMTDVDFWDEDADAVTLMTMHSSKGLEFPSVYIAGVERGLFPLPKSFDKQDELEEERRLFYVGITRAQERLHISYADSRMRYGSHSGGASMFVGELPEEALEFERPAGFSRMSRPIRNQPIRHAMEFEDYSQESSDNGEISPFPVGSYIRHPKFGRGQIIGCSGSEEDIVLKIRFGTQEKKIMPKYAKLVPA